MPRGGIAMGRAAKVDPYNIAELLHALGDIPPQRVLLHPAPGKATEADLLKHSGRSDTPCELVDGTLVEKPVGYPESSLMLHVAYLLRLFLETARLGYLAGSDGGFRLMEGLVRLPDISVIRKSKLPGGRRPREQVAALAPCLAIEILSPSNTRGEIKRKFKEYFLAGTELAWIIDPRRRTVRVHTAPDVFTTLGEGDTLDGGAVLPGFSLTVACLLDPDAEPET